MPGPLTGIRVIELGVGVQGPLAATYLADMGAEVIKIEPPTGAGSRWNLGPADLPEQVQAPMFIAANRGKRFMQLDAHTDEARDVLYKLVESADVLVTNYREAAMRRLGLDYDVLAKRNPRLVYGSVNGFGHTGPDATKSMWDLCAQARSGLANATGRADDLPNLPGAIIADAAGGTVLALGIVTALVAREREGIGQRVDTSGYGALAWLQSWEITHTGMTGQVRDREGPYHPLIPGSYGVYQTKDGKSLAYMDSLTDAGFRKFCEFGGIPELAGDPRFDSMRKRIGLGGAAEARAASELRPLLERAFASHSLAEWTAFLDELGPDQGVYQEVFDYADVVSDPQALACGYVVEREVPGLGKRKLAGNPIALSETPATPGAPGGELGQDTEIILLELGYDWDFIAKLREQNQAAIDEAFDASLTEAE